MGEKEGELQKNQHQRTDKGGAFGADAFKEGVETGPIVGGDVWLENCGDRYAKEPSSSAPVNAVLL